MSSTCLRATLALTLCSISPLAWAGGGTDSGGGGGTVVTDSATDSGGTGGTGDTGGTGTGGSTGEGSSSGDICGECTPSGEPVQIISPVDGAVVGRTFDVRVTAPYSCSCDTMCCNTFYPTSLTLRIDVMTVDVCNASDDCDTTDHTFTVADLAPGTYELDAIAPVDGSAEFSQKVTITVEGEVATGDGTTGSGEAGGVTVGMTSAGGTSNGSSSGDTGAAAGGSDGGCGCRSEPGPRGLAPLGLGLLLLATRRRRR